MAGSWFRAQKTTRRYVGPGQHRHIQSSFSLLILFTDSSRNFFVAHRDIRIALSTGEVCRGGTNCAVLRSAKGMAIMRDLKFLDKRSPVSSRFPNKTLRRRPTLKPSCSNQILHEIHLERCPVGHLLCFPRPHKQACIAGLWASIRVRIRHVEFHSSQLYRRKRS